jgi:hypothetical protein
VGFITKTSVTVCVVVIVIEAGGLDVVFDVALWEFLGDHLEYDGLVLYLHAVTVEDLFLQENGHVGSLYVLRGVQELL